MTRARQIANLIAVVVPFVCVLAAIVLLWNSFVGWAQLSVMIVMYLLTGFGITVGFHRLFTHRSFKTSRPVRYLFAVLGSMAVEGPVITWVANHRKHHAFADEEGDPHSPHTTHGSGPAAAIKGLWHAHIGWMFKEDGQAERARFAPDLLKDRGLRAINAGFFPLMLLSLVLPFALGYAIGGTLTDALLGLLWGGAVRIFLLHHVTWSINSVCHFFGRRRFDTTDKSTNVPWLSVLSFGEAWHHNHHAFPTSARHGLRWWELALDPGGLLITAMEKLGLVWDVVKISPERQRQKSLVAAPAAAPQAP
ncbi:MAG TPA: fatty acid desaturase [Thermoleophilaceae bacterium]|nr:fatty acid desaturase [Thermoleophilaceae bacterium]